MSLALEFAQLAGISVAGAGAIVLALYGRKALKWFSKLSTLATIGIAVLVVLGVGAIVGWWSINLGTIGEHLGLLVDVIGDLAGMVL